MYVRDEDKQRLEELDEQRRRIIDDFNFLVQRIREGSISDTDQARRQAQHLHVRHEGLIQNMIELLGY
jgi:hypothetical protein